MTFHHGVQNGWMNYNKIWICVFVILFVLPPVSPASRQVLVVKVVHITNNLTY